MSDAVEASAVPQRAVVQLFTDGACLGNPGPGGWACLLKHPQSGRTKELRGGEHATTNNRMEIMAVLQGLEALKVTSSVELFSDSQYVINAIGEWMPKWKRFGWKRTKHAVALVRNDDLWRRLDALLQVHSLKTTWVRGHDGHPENERCDELACLAAREIAAIPPPLKITGNAASTPTATLFAPRLDDGRVGEADAEK